LCILLIEDVFTVLTAVITVLNAWTNWNDVLKSRGMMCCVEVKGHDCDHVTTLTSMGLNMIVEWRGMTIEVCEGLILKYKEYVCDVFILVLLI